MNNQKKQILKKDIVSPSQFKIKFREEIIYLKEIINKENNKILLLENEIGDLILSVIRVNDFNVLNKEKNKIYLNFDNLIKWIKIKMLPNFVVLNLDDEDVLKLLIFCIEITYQMHKGGSRATITQKGFRERKRTFESILVDQFIGKLGEVFFKKFIETNFSKDIFLDWNISPQIEVFKNDILNAKEKISIKTSPSISGIWAEADLGYDYGIMVKTFVPQAIILQFFIEVCGFSKLLDFVELKISKNDIFFKNLIFNMRNRIKKYKCGEISSSLKGYIAGYFKTKDFKPIEKGTNLEFLGEVKETRYLVSLDKLKYQKEDWQNFINSVLK